MAIDHTDPAAMRAEAERRHKLRAQGKPFFEPSGAPVDARTPDEIARDERVLEKDEQRECTRIFQAHGYFVRNTSQARASKIAPGVSDLLVTHNTRPVFFFFEVKRQVGGKLSPDQIAFRDDMIRCGIRYFHGDRYEAQRVVELLRVAPNPG